MTLGVGQQARRGAKPGGQAACRRTKRSGSGLSRGGDGLPSSNRRGSYWGITTTGDNTGCSATDMYECRFF